MSEQNRLTEERNNLEKRRQTIENNFNFYTRSTSILDALSKTPNL